MFSLLRRGPDRLTPQQAHQRTSDGKAVLLDVREKPEWTAGHAPNSVHVPLTSLLTGGTLPAEARGRPLVVICRSGHRSRQAVKLLTERGAQAVDVEGGMNAWAAAGYPVVDARGNSGKTA